MSNNNCDFLAKWTSLYYTKREIKRWEGAYILIGLHIWSKKGIIMYYYYYI